MAIKKERQSREDIQVNMYRLHFARSLALGRPFALAPALSASVSAHLVTTCLGQPQPTPSL